MDHNKLWKILKEMGIPDHFICLLGNLYAGQEATVRTGHATMHWFQIGKGVHKVDILIEVKECEQPIGFTEQIPEYLGQGFS